MNNETFNCASCGCVVPVHDRVYVEGEAVCRDCADDSIICSHCNERIWSDNNFGSDYTPLCETCCERHYVRCSDCGAVIRESYAYYCDDSPYCERCYERINDTADIHGYYYKPSPIFHGYGPRYFGVELEIDGAGETFANARELLSIGNADKPYIYCKHDGSLEDGFEIVTHPMSLLVQQTEMPWDKLCKKAVDMGYSSHSAGTCGLHIHVSRNSFGDTYEEQEATIARVLYFFEKFWDELLKFSRRTQRQLSQWAKRYGYKEHPREILDCAKSGHNGRYTCVNLTNEDTVEFRMFRGTLKANTIIATLQLVDRICDMAVALTDDMLKELSWTTFVTGCPQAELLQYLKERRLYVNEPVAAEAEV